MTDSDKEEEVKQKLTSLTKESGVEGAARLALLFIKKHGQEASLLGWVFVKTDVPRMLFHLGPNLEPKMLKRTIMKPQTKERHDKKGSSGIT